MSDDDDDAPSVSYQEPEVKKPRVHLWERADASPGPGSVGTGQCGSTTSSSVSSPASSSSGDSPCRMVVAWRAEHLAKAVFDNTVNSMIENMSFPLPLFGNIMDGYSASRGDHTLEDQAVRMAIRSHGLQKPCSCSQRRPVPHSPCYRPFHQRAHPSIFGGGPSTSSSSSSSSSSSAGPSSRHHQQPNLDPPDILSEAVSVAILNKGLGTSHGTM